MTTTILCKTLVYLSSAFFLQTRGCRAANCGYGWDWSLNLTMVHGVVGQTIYTSRNALLRLYQTVLGCPWDEPYNCVPEALTSNFRGDPVSIDMPARDDFYGTFPTESTVP